MPASKVDSVSDSRISKENAQTSPRKDVAIDLMKNTSLKLFFRQLVSGSKKLDRNKRRKQTAVRGVYYVVPSDACQRVEDIQSSHRTLRTRCNSHESDSDDCPFDYSNDTEPSFPLWTPSTSVDHHKDAPLIVRTPKHDERYNEEDDSKLLRKVLGKSRNLPQPSRGMFASNHVIINSERTRRSIAPLVRNQKLDEVAREHAARMARWNEVYHVRDPASLCKRIHRDASDDDDADHHGNISRKASASPPDESCHRLGENVSCGRNLKDVHQVIMSSPSERNNILDRRFLSMGVGTAVAKDGTLYLCQIFSG